MTTPHLAILLLGLVACGGGRSIEAPSQEGVLPGECSDGVDNDENGDVDCDDAGCANSLDCCSDEDGDGVCDAFDACPGGDDHLDADLDGQPDACDPCPSDLTDDLDGDGVCDSDDRCEGFDDALDADGDGQPDACDPCPQDPLDDSDGDSICDGDDVCPLGDDRLDGDFDGVADACDPCPRDPTDDTDGDGVCDGSDLCPGGDDTIDQDGDGTPDDCDPCPQDNPDDADQDGVCDGVDLCLGGSDLMDFDLDGIPDDCDADADGDGWDAPEDCDDLDPDVHPMAGDVLGDGLDSDCDGADCAGVRVGDAYFVTCPFAGDRDGAQAFCQGLGHDGLASIRSGAEQLAVRALGDPAWVAWLGGTDAAFEGAWVWAPGYALRHAEWLPDRPYDASAAVDADCMYRVPYDDPDPTLRGLWGDEDCAAILDAAVCESRCWATGDSDGDGVCDDVDLCVGEDLSRDLDGDGICDDQDIDSALRAYYPLDGSTADHGGQSRHATPMNGVLYRAGVRGAAAAFDGMDTFVDTGITDHETAFSVSFWYLMNTFASDEPGLIQKGGDWQIGIQNGGLVPNPGAGAVIYGPDTGLDPAAMFSDQAAPVTWYHMVMVFDGTQLSLYTNGVDGDPSPFDNITAYRSPVPDPIVFGNLSPVPPPLPLWFYGGANHLDGRLDEIRIYGRALSAAEVQALLVE